MNTDNLDTESLSNSDPAADSAASAKAKLVPGIPSERIKESVSFDIDFSNDVKKTYRKTPKHQLYRNVVNDRNNTEDDIAENQHEDPAPLIDQIPNGDSEEKHLPFSIESEAAVYLRLSDLTKKSSSLQPSKENRLSSMAELLPSDFAEGVTKTERTSVKQLSEPVSLGETEGLGADPREAKREKGGSKAKQTPEPSSSSQPRRAHVSDTTSQAERSYDQKPSKQRNRFTMSNSTIQDQSVSGVKTECENDGTSREPNLKMLTSTDRYSIGNEALDRKHEVQTEVFNETKQEIHRRRTRIPSALHSSHSDSEDVVVITESRKDRSHGHTNQFRAYKSTPTTPRPFTDADTLGPDINHQIEERGLSFLNADRPKSVRSNLESDPGESCDSGISLTETR